MYENVIYLNDKAQEIESLNEKKSEDNKRDSSSEGDFVDSLDTMHETITNSSPNHLNTDLNVPACSIVKSSSFSGVTEREILRNKVKELYKLYSDIGCSADMLKMPPQKTNTEQSARAGKYNKKAAPQPPNEKETNSAIKATLVLKPGIIKTLPPQIESSKSEIFLSHSPKPTKRKTHSPMSRLMMLPKKMVFWNHKDESSKASDDDKRFSWSMFAGGGGGGHHKSLFTKQYSKSHEDLQNTRKFDYLCDEDLLSYNSVRKEDHYRVRKLSASPTFCRRIQRAKMIDELELD